MKALIFISLTFLVSNCNNTKNSLEFERIEEKYVLSYENWSLEPDSKSKQDSVLLYINEMINVSKDDFYKVEKIKFLCRIEKYNEALAVFETFKEQKSFTTDLLHTLIKLKINPKDEIPLQAVYQKWKNKKLTVEENLYKIGLDNYFQGNDYAINEINSIIKRHDLSSSNQELYQLLREKIDEKEDRMEVLFYLYNL